MTWTSLADFDLGLRSQIEVSAQRSETSDTNITIMFCSDVPPNQLPSHWKTVAGLRYLLQYTVQLSSRGSAVPAQNTRPPRQWLPEGQRSVTTRYVQIPSPRNKLYPSFLFTPRSVKRRIEMIDWPSPSTCGIVSKHGLFCGLSYECMKFHERNKPYLIGMQRLVLGMRREEIQRVGTSAVSCQHD